MKFDYLPHIIKNHKTNQIIEEIFYPVVPVRLYYKHTLSKYQINCMVDSGSDRNLFPAEWGENIGINIKKGELIKIGGIGGIDIEAYRHRAKLYIGLINFDVEIDFCYSQKIPLLGRKGFFNLFKKIIFNEEERLTELILPDNSKFLKSVN